jgi:Fur family ferric uptake transcriptional regulator
VYRALELFVNVGVVVAVEPGDGETCYKIKRRQHHHLICRHCGHDQEIDDLVFRGMIDRVS